MQAVLNDPAEREVRIFKIRLSGIKQDGQQINKYLSDGYQGNHPKIIDK